MNPNTHPARVVDHEALARACARWHVHRLSLFGSVARGEDRAWSDVDLLVDPAPGFSMGDRLGLKAALRDLFGREVDLVERESLNGYMNRFLRRSVLAEAQVIYEAPSD